MINRKEVITIAVAIIVVFVVAYFAIYLPLEQNQNSGVQGTPPGESIPNGYHTALDKVFTVSSRSNVNYSIDLGSYSNISAIALFAYSNMTPGSLNLEANGFLFDQINLPYQNNAFSSGTTYADPPYVKVYGGIWYLNIYNVSVSGQMHVIVSFKPP